MSLHEPKPAAAPLPPGYNASPLQESPELQAMAARLVAAGVLVYDPAEIGAAACRGAEIARSLTSAEMEVADIARQIGALGHTFVASRLARAVAAMSAITGAVERGQLMVLVTADPPVTTAATPARAGGVVHLEARRELARFNAPLGAEPKDPSSCA